MFEEKIRELWQDWYQNERPKKIHWIPIALVAIVMEAVGLIVTIENAMLGIGMFVTGFVMHIVIGCVVSSRSGKVSESAVEYCWKCGVYNIGRNSQFPFMHTDAENVIGGKTFRYEDVEVVLYDTHYGSEYKDPGMLVEFIPDYPVGKGVPVWEKDHLEVPAELGLKEKTISCMEQIIRYEHRHHAYPKCKRNEDKFYLYVTYASMGLIVDESGRLYLKTAFHPEGCWGKADDIVRIMEENLL